MGENSARFNDDLQCPVEQVSWKDCLGFIEAINAHLTGGPLLRLPTEAEWEYACRAGSNGPFSWGDTLTTAQVNYDGNHSYPGGKKGEYRARTLPVLSFEPNAWGLYQMHGNVREWCSDWLGDYPAEQVLDPAGPAKGRIRVLRGGSWVYDGRYLRSAFRFAFTPGSRFNFIGLRLAGG